MADVIVSELLADNQKTQSQRCVGIHRRIWRKSHKYSTMPGNCLSVQYDTDR